MDCSPGLQIQSRRIRKSPKSFQIRLTKSTPPFLDSQNFTLTLSEHKSELTPKLKFFDQFSHFPSLLKTRLRSIGRRINHSDIEGITQELLDEGNDEHKELDDLVSRQTKKLENMLSQKNAELLNHFKGSLVERKKKIDVQRKLEESSPLLPCALLLVKSHASNSTASDSVEESFELSEGMKKVKKTSSFNCETPNTCSSKIMVSPFNEKKNLLLSSKIEEIIDEGFDVFCKKLDYDDFWNENDFGLKINFDALLEEEDERVGREEEAVGMDEDKIASFF